MFDLIIKSSLKYRWLVVLLGVALLAGGVYSARTMPVDVLPDLAAPTVTVVTEATGMAPEEVERLITVPLENTLGGAQGVRRIRSSSGIGISIVWVEFDWDVELLPARQAVTERLSASSGSYPLGVEPIIAPTSSIMGEVMFVGVIGEEAVSDIDLRDASEWTVRRRLLAVPGVAQVVPIGGALKQVQITLRPDRLALFELGVDDVLSALEGFSETHPGGFFVTGPQEYVVRAAGRVQSLDVLRDVVVAHREHVPIALRDIAHVEIGEAIRRGEAALDGEHGVVLKVQKQPGANTLQLTERLDAELDDVAETLPEGITLYRKGFRQADFIQVAVDNVLVVLRDAAILVAIILAMFLMSWRSTLISLVALPLSLLAGLIALDVAGASINTMTLGGFAIAIGELVDDAIIDVENVFRRMRENRDRPPAERLSAFEVVYRASKEIRASVVFATVILIMVFAPLFMLEGLEGRLLAPLGLAYVLGIVASLFVALTITPALCLILLKGRFARAPFGESRLAAWLKRVYRPAVAGVLSYPVPIGVASLGGAGIALATLLLFGRNFLPEFNEGALNITAATAPGTSLETSDEIVGRLEQKVSAHENVTAVIRVTGRAERDEHALDVSFSELEVDLDVDKDDRARVLREIRDLSAAVPGLTVNVGQPISHRIEHMVSGVRASLAVKFFGDDLEVLRRLAGEAAQAMRGVPGVVDINVEQLTEVPQLVVTPRPPELAAIGRTPGELSRVVHMVFEGEPIATWWEENRTYEVRLGLPRVHRESLELLGSTPIDGEGTRYATLASVATIGKTTAPNLINRENGQRRIHVTANVAGRDLVGAAEDVRQAVEGAVARPVGYRFELGGQFESEARASRRILLLTAAVLVMMTILLTVALRSARDAVIVLLNVPLALVGGTVAVWLGGGVLTIASLVGFITLFGIATRNGILMMTHFQQLTATGMNRREAVIQGSVDRLLPILMTALTAALALIPIVLATGEPGNEIQGPLAAVILGGLTSSTLLNLFVVPAVYLRFGRVPDPSDEPDSRVTF